MWATTHLFWLDPKCDNPNVVKICSSLQGRLQKNKILPKDNYDYIFCGEKIYRTQLIITKKRVSIANMEFFGYLLTVAGFERPPVERKG